MRDRRVGLAAAVLLAINPLYRMEAHRALNDVPGEALSLASLAMALWAWRAALGGRPWAAALAGFAGSGVLGGLAALTKLTGVALPAHVATWAALACVLPWARVPRKALVAAGAVTFTVAATLTFVAGNPTMTASPAGPLDPEPAVLAREGPPGRFLAMIRHRVAISSLQQKFYPHYALKGLRQKAEVVFVQGFGRFSPFGPTRSHQPALLDWVQDRWALAWAPWVALGVLGAAFGGLRQARAGRPPTAWAVVGSAAVTLAGVVGYIPLAWDRYLLPLQPWSALLAAYGATAAFDAIASNCRPFKSNSRP